MNHTIKSSFEVKGVGIHSGKPCTLTVKPKESLGIECYRSDTHDTIFIHPQTIGLTAVRSTKIQGNHSQISTPEHFLAACFRHNIYSLYLEIDSEEFPILDGSAIEFSKLFEKVGLKKCTESQSIIEIDRKISLTEEGASLSIEPHTSFEIYYKYEYSNTFLGIQEETLSANKHQDLDIVLSARTFAFEHEVEALHANNLGLGGSLDNTLVIGESNFINTPRFNNECAKHKICDILGDFHILGRPLKGKVIGKKSGHSLNLKMVKELDKIYNS